MVDSYPLVSHLRVDTESPFAHRYDILTVVVFVLGFFVCCLSTFGIGLRLWL